MDTRASTGAVDAVAIPSHRRRATPFLQRINRPAFAILAVALIAGGLRFYRLSQPPGRIFDEIYYSKDGCVYAGYSNRTCAIVSDNERYWIDTYGETSWVHPPLGRWAIAAGERAFGPHSFGWRFSAAVFGTASVVLLAIIAQLLFGSALWTFVTGLLLGVEGLNFVQSRTAMLDIFLTFWIVLGFLLLGLDRRWIDRRTRFGDEGIDENGDPTSTPSSVPTPILRPWRLASGAAFGAALATKWSGITPILGAVALCLMWERTRRKRGGFRHPIGRAVVEEGFGIVLSFAFVPLAVYLAAYLPWFAQRGFDPPALWKLQQAMFDYHFHLQTVNPKNGEPIHPYLSSPFTWLYLGRPVAYYFKGPGTEVLALGNPMIFWGSFLTIPYLFLAWWKKRDWKAGFVLVSMQYLPWALVTRPQFFFYMAPVTPFLVLGGTYFLKDLSEAHLAGSRARPFLPIAVAYVVGAVAAFAFLWPILTGYPLSRDAWELRMWFGSWI